MTPPPTGWPAASTMSPAPTTAPGGAVFGGTTVSVMVADYGTALFPHRFGELIGPLRRKYIRSRQQPGVARQGGDDGVEPGGVLFGNGEQGIDVAGQERLQHGAVIGMQDRP